MPSRNWCEGNLAMSSSSPGSWFTHLEEIATTYEIDLHQALQMPWPKNSWKSFCKNAVKCHWSNKMLTNASQKSTLKHIVWNNWIEQAHGKWRVCRERPFLSEAATTRARILVGRINIQASSPQSRDLGHDNLEFQVVVRNLEIDMRLVSPPDGHSENIGARSQLSCHDSSLPSKRIWWHIMTQGYLQMYKMMWNCVIENFIVGKKNYSCCAWSISLQQLTCDEMRTGTSWIVA